MKEQSEDPKHLLLFRGPGWHDGLSPEEIQTVMDEWFTWFERLAKQGKLKSGHPLGEGGRVVRGEKNGSVVDGPFVESKESIGGYFLLQVHDFAEAIKIASECPALKYGLTVEVRPVVDVCTAGEISSEIYSRALAE